MTTPNNRINRKKQGPALIVAFGMTALIAVVMLGMGISALFGGSVSAAQAAPAVESIDVSGLSTEELQALVEQYQAREAQYQAELSQAADQLSQANTQVQEYENLFAQLQQAGVIRISANGQITVSAPAFGPRDHDDHGFWGGDD